MICDKVGVIELIMIIIKILVFNVCIEVGCVGIVGVVFGVVVEEIGYVFEQINYIVLDFCDVVEVYISEIEEVGG